MSITTIYFPTLRAWDRNKVRAWSVQVEGTTNNARLCTTFGFADGVMDQKYTEIVGKNIGKANATTSREQAIR